jgi:ribonuclease HI
VTATAHFDGCLRGCYYGLGSHIQCGGLDVKAGRSVEADGKSTEGEVEAAIQTLELAAPLVGGGGLTLYGDSRAVVDLINAPGYLPKWVRPERLLRLRGAQGRFSLLVVEWVPRERNKEADKLAGQGGLLSLSKSLRESRGF